MNCDSESDQCLEEGNEDTAMKTTGLLFLSLEGERGDSERCNALGGLWESHFIGIA